MDLDLYRGPSAHGCTIGRLAVNGVFQCYTLEDTVRETKLPGSSAIPAGRYAVTLTKSERFGVMLPLIQKVPQFRGVRIHSGNTSSDTSGCVLVGTSRTPFSVLGSRAALGKLMPVLSDALARGQNIWLTVHEAVKGAA